MATGSTNAPQVSDAQRKKLEKEIAAALALIYLKRWRATEKMLGEPISKELPAKILAKIDKFADDRSQLVQDGINQYFTNALDALPKDASPQQIATAIRHAAQEISDYNNDVLTPYLDSWAYHQSLYDSGENYDALGGMDWVWTQKTDFEDECMAADAKSPAPLDELMSITGGMPPVHERCDCDCDRA